MTERTLTALRNNFEGKVYIIIKGEELQKQFLKDAVTKVFISVQLSRQIVLPMMLLHSSRTNNFRMSVLPVELLFSVMGATMRKDSFT